MNPKRTKFLWSLFYFFLIIMGIVAAMLIWPAYRDYREQQNELFKLKDHAAEKRRERTELKQEVDSLEKDPKAVEKVAREKFGLCEEGETVIIYNPPPSPQKNQVPPESE